MNFTTITRWLRFQAGGATLLPADGPRQPKGLADVDVRYGARALRMPAHIEQALLALAPCSRHHIARTGSETVLHNSGLGPQHKDWLRKAMILALNRERALEELVLLWELIHDRKSTEREELTKRVRELMEAPVLIDPDIASIVYAPPGSPVDLVFPQSSLVHALSGLNMDRLRQRTEDRYSPGELVDLMLAPGKDDATVFVRERTHGIDGAAVTALKTALRKKGCAI